jgi:hypothetical protein
MREVQGGMGFASQSEFALHFGVPEPAAVDRVTILWPSSRVQELTGDRARAILNHHIRLEEGAEPVVTDSKNKPPDLRETSLEHSRAQQFDH